MLLYILGCIAAFALLTYLLPLAYSQLTPAVNFKKRYGAEWALVTGSSSGIGKAIAEQLAQRGLSVVLVALGDALLDETHDELTKRYPTVRFRKVGVNLSDQAAGYMEDIIRATSDIRVNVVFNNAGYIVTGFFHHVPVDNQIRNMNVNAVAALRITHHFYTRMVADRQRGCIVFTSSAAGCIPSPFAVMYSSTKAYLSAMAASLAVEARARGIDVLAVHPSPVASRFLTNATKLNMFDLSYRNAWTPDAIATYILRAVGKGVWADIGGFAIVTRLATKIIDGNFLAIAFSIAAPFMPDYKKNDAIRPKAS